MARRVVILGAGPAGRRVNYILSYDLDIEVIGHTDRDQTLAGREILGKPVLGTDETLTECYAQGVRHAVIGVGDPQVRAKLRKLATESGFELVNAMHPSAIVSPHVRLGQGVILAEGVVVSDNPIIEDNTWVGFGALIGHDARIGRDGLVGGRAAVGSGSQAGERVLLGFGCVIGLGLRIGDDAIVGSGANVIRDVEACAVVVGNPARVIKYLDRSSK